ncbi:hypothetical protein D3C85_939630 [compost metagenome]
MITGSISAHSALRKAAAISADDLRGGGTIFSRRTSQAQVIHSAPPISSPGTMAARNSLEIDTLAATPKITRPMLGGITGPITPVAAMRPAARGLSWPARTIIGSSSAVSAAASATAEPESADSRQPAMMVT